MSLSNVNSPPLYIVEDHSDILNHILRNIGSKKLNFSDNLLIHFDAHPDLLVNPDLHVSEIFEKEILLDKISIETWILPMAYAGHVNSIVWIKPDWANQMDDGSYSFFIGQDNSGEVKVTLPNLYFISALNYAPIEKIKDFKEITLDVITLDKSKDSQDKCLNLLQNIISKNNSGKNLILDIDLDFFSCSNPFLKLYEHCNLYEVLKHFYTLKDSDVTSPEKAVIKRTKQFKVLEAIFNKLDKLQAQGKEKMLEYIGNFSSESFEDLKSLEIFSNMCRNLIQKSENGLIDWLLIHDAGTTIDDETRALPHHNSYEDAKVSLQSFRLLIESLELEPSLISIARSSLDEYCPPDHVEHIQESVLETLNKFKPVVTKSYLEQAQR